MYASISSALPEHIQKVLGQLVVGKFERGWSYDDHEVRMSYCVAMGGSDYFSENSAYSVALDRLSHFLAGHYSDLAPPPLDRTCVNGQVSV